MIDLQKMDELEKLAIQAPWFVTKYNGHLRSEGDELKEYDYQLIDFLRNHARKIIRELEAAREIVSYHRASLCAATVPDCSCYGCHLLRKYDEVVND